MNDEKMYVPYIVYEGEMARQERQIKRLLCILVTLLVLFFASNMAWLYVWDQYEYVEETETTTIDAKQYGEDISYGSDSNDRKEEKTTQAEEEKR